MLMNKEIKMCCSSCCNGLTGHKSTAHTDCNDFTNGCPCSCHDSKKCNCQHEKNHSPECPLYVEPKFPDSKGWIEKFDLQFPSWNKLIELGISSKVESPERDLELKEIKQFIKDLLSQEQGRIIKDLEGMKPPHDFEFAHDHAEQGYNQALSDAINKIKGNL